MFWKTLEKSKTSYLTFVVIGKIIQKLEIKKIIGAGKFHWNLWCREKGDL